MPTIRSIAAVLLVLGAAAPAGAIVVNKGPNDDWVEYHDATRSQHASKITQWEATHRLISINLSGVAADARVAAVWVKGNAAQAITPATTCCTLDQLVYSIMWHSLALDYQPVSIAATGSGDTAIFAAVFEPGHGDISIATDLSKGALNTRNDSERDVDHRILRSLDFYGTAAQPRYAAVWERVTVPGAPASPAVHPSWSADVGESAGDWGIAEEEHRLAGERPGLLAPAGDGTYATAWYESLFGDTEALIGLDLAGLASAIAARPTMIPMQVQYANSKYAVLFAETYDIVLQPERRVTGWTGAAQKVPSSAATTMAYFDDQILRYMQQHGLRSGSVAVTHQGRLVHVRAFTWAEIGSGTPATTPADDFGVGSITKLYTSALAYRLDSWGTLSLEDRLLPTLGKADSFADDPRVAEVRLGDLLAHRSGFKHWAAGADVVADYYGVTTITNDHQIDYNLTNDDGVAPFGSCNSPDEAIEDSETDLCFAPRSEFGYGNLAYSYAAEMIRARVSPMLSFEDILGLYLFMSLYETNPAYRPYIGDTDNWPGNGAHGALKATAPQVAKLLAAFNLPADKLGPLDDATIDAMLFPLVLNDTELDFDRTNGGLLVEADDCGTSATIYYKGGSTSHSQARGVIRSDGVSIAIAMEGGHVPEACELSEWIAGVSWSALSGVDKFPTYHIPAFPGQ